MYLTTSECFMTDILNCGVADLSMLDECYSTLGEEAIGMSSILDTENKIDLNYILYELYNAVTLSVADSIEDIIEDNREGSLMVPVTDNAGNITEFKYLLMTDNVMVQLQKKANELRNTYPFANCLDTHFQNDLDQTVDWEASVNSNAENLIEYWYKNEELELTDEDFDKNP